MKFYKYLLNLNCERERDMGVRGVDEGDKETHTTTKKKKKSEIYLFS